MNADFADALERERDFKRRHARVAGHETFLGVGVGDGWWPVVESLVVKIESLDHDVRFSQIKSKFGDLRVYFDVPPGPRTKAFVDALIEATAAKCSKMCERCGDPGVRCTTRMGLAAVLCERCRRVAR